MNFLEQNIEALRGLCRRHRVKTMHVFGSVLTPRFNKESDIDLLVEFEPISLMDYADNYFALHQSLTRLFGREVDLVVGSSVTNPYLRAELDETKQLVYG